MNTLEILYQAFRVRYSLNQLQEVLDRGCRVALLGPGSGVADLRAFLGDPVPAVDERQPQENLIDISWDLGEADLRLLRTCDACLIYYPEGVPEVEDLEEMAAKIPIYVKSLWLCASEDHRSGSYHEKDLSLPTVRALPQGKGGPAFLRLLMTAMPQVSLVLARDWANVRSIFCKTLTRRTALRNGVRSGLSSLPLKAVPVVGPILSMLATSAETMMLTSSQLRLSFVVAAVHGRPIDFFDRIAELWPIIGTAFGFRGLSRALVKMLPTGGPALKASVAFSGTFAVGEASRLFYEQGQPTSDEVRRELLRRSHEEGARQAKLLLRKVLVGQPIEDDEGDEIVDMVDELTNSEKTASPVPLEKSLAVSDPADTSAEVKLSNSEKPNAEPEPKEPLPKADKPETKSDSEPKAETKKATVEKDESDSKASKSQQGRKKSEEAPQKKKKSSRKKSSKKKASPKKSTKKKSQGRSRDKN